MRFRRYCKIEECASKDTTRFHLVNAHLDIEGKVIVATDGHCMAVVPVAVEDGDTSGPVTEDALKSARKLARGEERATLKASDKLRTTDGAEHRRPDSYDCRFPPYMVVVPRYEANDPRTVTISFNPGLLMAIVNAIGAMDRRHGYGGISITFRTDDNLAPILVNSDRAETADCYGVLMPMRSDRADASAAKHAQATTKRMKGGR